MDNTTDVLKGVVDALAKHIEHSGQSSQNLITAMKSVMDILDQITNEVQMLTLVVGDLELRVKKLEQGLGTVESRTSGLITFGGPLARNRDDED